MQHPIPPGQQVGAAEQIEPQKTVPLDRPTGWTLGVGPSGQTEGKEAHGARATDRTLHQSRPHPRVLRVLVQPRHAVHRAFTERAALDGGEHPLQAKEHQCLALGSNGIETRTVLVRPSCGFKS